MTKIETLHEMRLAKRLTQSEVASKLGVSQSYYSAIERGEKPTEIHLAMTQINKMRSHLDRTEGGGQKAGRKKLKIYQITGVTGDGQPIKRLNS